MLPLGADRDRAAGNACSKELKEPLGGGGGGVVEGGGGGGVVDGGGGGGVVDGGGGVLPPAVTVAVTGMRHVVEMPGPDCPM
ncbi:hypothetical protein FBQ96_04455 [Nitrospirales bacterium NOB]|nr:hypothetical protein [Nitrospira sp. NTP2]MDL1888826.1 hypothetical protein [Nitrospirales bacterium NOB]